MSPIFSIFKVLFPLLLTLSTTASATPLPKLRSHASQIRSKVTMNFPHLQANQARSTPSTTSTNTLHTLTRRWCDSNDTWDSCNTDLNTAAIVGIVIGGLIFLCIISAIMCACVRSSRGRKNQPKPYNPVYNAGDYNSATTLIKMSASPQPSEQYLAPPEAGTHEAWVSPPPYAAAGCEVDVAGKDGPAAGSSAGAWAGTSV